MRVLVKILPMAGVLVVGVACAVYFAPRYLTYATGCDKVDAIVVLLGPDFNARHRHARYLVSQGMADYLIIPAYRQIYQQNGPTLKLVDYPQRPDNTGNSSPSFLSLWYEDTHLELLEAKRVMDLNGYRKAIFVSSPYHMRRIQLMVRREYGKSYTAYFSPTPYEPAPVVIWELDASDWKKVRREYTKIAWFMVYSSVVKWFS